MSEPSAPLLELYQQVVLAHARAPRLVGELPADAPGVRVARGDNPLCGDAVVLSVRLSACGAMVVDARQSAQGCAICCAAASVLATRAVEAPVTQVREAIVRLRELVAGALEPDMARDGELAAFAGVAAYPARHRCALLAARALEAALDAEATPVTTEHGGEG